MDTTMYIKTDKIVLLQQLDLFTEYCLQCESILLVSGNENHVGMIRDCADMNVLLSQYIQRKSALEKPLLKCSIESWSLCLIMLSEYEHDSTFEKCYEICQTCISDFKEYI
jgi:hypothetical protein